MTDRYVLLRFTDRAPGDIEPSSIHPAAVFMFRLGAESAFAEEIGTDDAVELPAGSGLDVRGGVVTVLRSCPECGRVVLTHLDGAVSGCVDHGGSG